MTLRHLEIFRAVCTQESVTQAAERLNMTQPAVSMAIRELETFYGVRLFERMNRRLYITEAGRSLLQYADTVLSQFQESVQVLRQGGTRGRCRFGMTVTIGETWLPAILTRLKEKLPELDVEAFIQNSRRTEEMVLQNEIDFALVDNVSSASRSQRVSPLFRETMAAVCAQGFLSGQTALPLSELAEQPLLLRESGSGTRSSVDAVFQAAGLKAVPVVEGISASALLSCAAMRQRSEGALSALHARTRRRASHHAGQGQCLRAGGRLSGRGGRQRGEGLPCLAGGQRLRRLAELLSGRLVRGLGCRVGKQRFRVSRLQCLLRGRRVAILQRLCQRVKTSGAHGIQRIPGRARLQAFHLALGGVDGGQSVAYAFRTAQFTRQFPQQSSQLRGFGGLRVQRCGALVHLLRLLHHFGMKRFLCPDGLRLWVGNQEAHAHQRRARQRTDPG